MKRTALTVLVLMLAACGKGGADRYVGYWQLQDSDKLVVTEIKKENGNYFAVENIAGRGKRAAQQRGKRRRIGGEYWDGRFAVEIVGRRRHDVFQQGHFPTY